MGIYDKAPINIIEEALNSTLINERGWKRETHIKALAEIKNLRDAVPDGLEQVYNNDFCYQNGLADNSGSVMTLRAAKVLNDFVGGTE